MRIFLEKL